MPFISVVTTTTVTRGGNLKGAPTRGLGLRFPSSVRSRALPPRPPPSFPMAMRNFYNEIKGMKVRDLPGHLKPMMSLDYVKKAIARGFDRYHDKYIETSSIQPLYHVCFGGMIFSYLVALPEERRHLEHQQQHGGGHH